MARTDTAFVGPIPELYDRLMGPMLFRPYAEDMARRLAWLKRGHMLETAAGTGIVTQALAAALPQAVSITATDLNQAMLDQATAKPGMARVTLRQADAQALPFDGAMFDGVVCQFGVMFFPDKAAAYAEVIRVLKPGGTFLFNVWSELAESPIPQTVQDTVIAQFPADPPRFMARVPHGYNDVPAISAALEEAGFAAVQAVRRREDCRSPSARIAAAAFCHGTPLRAEIEARGARPLDQVTEAAARALADRFAGGQLDVPIAASMEAIIFSATKPG